MLHELLDDLPRHRSLRKAPAKIQATGLESQYLEVTRAADHQIALPIVQPCNLQSYPHFPGAAGRDHSTHTPAGRLSSGVDGVDPRCVSEGNHVGDRRAPPVARRERSHDLRSPGVEDVSPRVAGQDRPELVLPK